MTSPIELPDRKEITLCEAVSAVAYGKCYSSMQLSQLASTIPTTPTQDAASGMWAPIPSALPTIDAPNRKLTSELLDRLQEAAYAGRVKFRAIKEGGNLAKGLKDIDQAFFVIPRMFNWQADVITDLDPESEEGTDWYFVHLDREQFVSLLKAMGVSVKDHHHVEDTTTYRTGAPGRPGSIHLFLPEARRRLDERDYPSTLNEFCEQLAEWLKVNHSGAHPVKPKTIENNIRDLWNARRTDPK